MTGAIPGDAAPTTPTAPTSVAEALSDGEWHRLHPASPLLKGGLFLLAIVGYALANARERLYELLFPTPGFQSEDPLDLILESGVLGWAILVIVALLLLLTAGFYVSWRMHTFRITGEVVEVRSGVLFRTNRKARLDRIQGINVVRPIVARLFGTAKLEVSQAGQNANVSLNYLGSAAADALRLEILRRASGAQRAPETATVPRAPVPDGSLPGDLPPDGSGPDLGLTDGSAPDLGSPDGSVPIQSVPVQSVPGQSAPVQSLPSRSLLDRRRSELIAPELDPSYAEPASVVHLRPGRLAGSIVLSGPTIVLVLFTTAVIVASSIAPQALIGLVPLIPAMIGLAGFYVSRFTRSLRYTIAGTPDGVRVGFGLLSTSNETMPPGRIHSVAVTQPLLWRSAGWWQVTVNRASHSSTQGASGQQNTTVLPVGTAADVVRVLSLVLPGLDDFDDVLERGLLGAGGSGHGYTVSPKRAAILHPFSWRRNGFLLTPSIALLRRGFIWRQLVLVPFARVQSVSVTQGLVGRMLGVSTVHAHTVAGPISARLGALDTGVAIGFVEDVARLAIAASATDSSGRWRTEPNP